MVLLLQNIGLHLLLQYLELDIVLRVQLRNLLLVVALDILYSRLQNQDFLFPFLFDFNFLLLSLHRIEPHFFIQLLNRA